MRAVRTSAALIVLLLTWAVATGEPPVTDLGGPRQVRGQVTATAAGYTVRVSFRPVRVFDPATNEEVNRELGREYAQRLLARHLSPDQGARFEASRDEVKEAKPDGDRFTMTVAWPRDGVRVLAGPSDPTAAGRVVPPSAFDTKFFTARQDHLDTLAAVAARNAAALRQTREEADAAPPADRRRMLARGVARTEDRGLTALDALAAAVKSDSNLLDLTERPEVLRAVSAARARFEADLRAALDGPTPPALPTFRDVSIREPFDGYLAANPLVMDLAGAVLVEAGGGDVVLIGVGKVVLRDGSAEDLLRAEKVGTLKARAAAVGERDGTRVTYLKRVEDRVVIVRDAAGAETARSVSDRLKVTQERVEGVAKNLPVVGRWRSGDGKVFYVAVGGRIPPELLPKAR